MKYSRSKYHKTVKELKRQDTNARKTIFAKSITKTIENLTKIKKINRGNSYIAVSINGKTQPGKICDIFREKYETLYSSSPTLKSEASQISKELNYRVEVESHHLQCKV